MSRRKDKNIFDARNDEFFMPDTYKQGWGQITGQKTNVKELPSELVYVATWSGTSDPALIITEKVLPRTIIRTPK